MDDALIGYSGFVGQTLIKQVSFDRLYRSANIDDIRHKKFNMVICAGAPAQKWLANKEPVNDKKSLCRLMENLSAVECKTFILISTVDVFSDSSGVNELSIVNEDKLHAYGLHRRQLEKFVIQKFENCLIVRLPGLVGPNLKKNIIFDFLNNNNISLIDSRSAFQFYPMVNLWPDISIALQAGLDLIHLTSEPVTVRDIAKEAFTHDFHNEILDMPTKYDFQTCHAKLYSSCSNYIYSKKETMLAIRAYAQSEARR